MRRLKLIAVILVGGLAGIILGLSSCSSKKALDNHSLEIWGMGVEGECLKDIIDIFEEENPEIEVTVQSIPWGQAHEKLITAVAGDMAPDISQLGTTWIPEFTALDVLEPLNAYIQNSKEISQDKYFKGSWETGSINDEIYGIPWYVDTRVLFYRKDLLKEAGYDHPPRTWDELKEITRKLTVKDEKGKNIRCGITLPVLDAKTLVMFMWSNGGDVLSEDGEEVVINSQENRETLDFYASFFKEGLSPRVSKGGIELYNNFKSGFTPMFIGGPWMLKELDTRVPEIAGKWDVAVMPMKKTATSFVGGSNLCIFKDSKNKQAAWEFIEFMSRPDIQIQWYKLTTDLPTRLEAWENDYFADKEKIKVFGRQLFDTKSPPRIQKWEEIAGAINLQMEKAILGKSSSEKVFQELEEKIGKILSKRR